MTHRYGGRRGLRALKTDRFFHVSKLAWMEQLDPPPALPVPMTEKQGVTFRHEDGFRRLVEDGGEVRRVPLPDYSALLGAE
jgi:hypothetical protein